MSTAVVPRPRLTLAATFQSHATLLLGLLGFMWVLELLDTLPFVYLDQFGIRPRTVAGLWGILSAPFLHHGFAHLMANSIPFVVLGGVVLLGGRRLFWAVTMFVILVGGFGVWLLAASHTNHLGASGLIFGYLGFLLARGVVERSLSWILVSIAILIGYGGLLFGVLPLHAGISWQSHLSGFFAGLAAARLLVSPQNRVIAKALPGADGRAELE